MSSSGETSGSKPLSLRERTASATAAHIREELAPVINALEDNQAELQSCVRQTNLLLDMQQQPWRKAGTMLWGMVVGALLFALSAASGSSTLTRPVHWGVRYSCSGLHSPPQSAL